MKQRTALRASFVCRECGGTVSKWQGQCPSCGAWNTLEEAVLEPRTASRSGGDVAPGRGRRATLDGVAAEASSRWGSGLPELDRVLGGGLVPGAVILIGGDPGIGKSTLMLQVLAAVAQERRALYVSGEESASQVAARGARLRLDVSRLQMLAETCLDVIIADIEREPVDLLVLDSIQTLYSESLGSAPGSVAQVRECAGMIVRAAKERAMAAILIGHVTREGSIAGPRILEHLVDTVIYFEGEPGSSIRVLRGLKNRFGSVNEIGVFAMDETGLRPVSNPSALFMARGGMTGPGVVLLATLEGSRPLLVQVQALVDRSAGTPRRVCTGFDAQRLSMLLAVMNRHLGMELGGFDVYVNIVGGLRINEPAADLAIILAVWSSMTSRPLPADLATFGEVGLAGEVRPVVGGQLRLAEARQLGVGLVIGAPCGNRRSTTSAMRYQPVRSVGETLEAVRQLS